MSDAISWAPEPDEEDEADESGPLPVDAFFELPFYDRRRVPPWDEMHGIEDDEAEA